jgi:type I restriction enzyme S subunit
MSLNRDSQSAAQPGLAVETIGTVHAPHPPDLEQRAIAAFLDRETARIDALVAKKERLIELLQEKRTALITRAVTKGLDPTVPMKDSGVEWLGEIPAHWEAPPLKRAIYYVEGPGIMASDFMPEGVPLLRISGIGGRKATLQGCNYLSIETVEEKWKQFRVRCGDLLISGSASTGFCTEVDEETEGAIPYTGIIIVRPRIEDVARDFVRWMLLSNLFTTQAELTRSGTTIQHFGPSHLARMRVVHPPLEEQQAIAAFLDRETAKVDALIAKVREAIERLKELRTALISAAVTGKIDVREEAA